MAIPNLTELCPALLVIDSQREFVTTGESAGAIATEDSTEALSRASALIDAAHDVGMPVIFTQEAHRKECVDFGRELDGDEGVHCIEGSNGVNFRPETNHAKAISLSQNVATAASLPQISIFSCGVSGWTRSSSAASSLMCACTTQP